MVDADCDTAGEPSPKSKRYVIGAPSGSVDPEASSDTVSGATPEAGVARCAAVGAALVGTDSKAPRSVQGTVPWPPAPAPGWVAGALAMGAAFLAGNMALQYGAARLPAHVTAVVMITEVLFASGSAVLLGAGTLTLPLALGGALIVGATLWSARG